MFAILNSGEVYGWTMRYVGAYFLPNPPVLVNGLSNPKDIQILSSRGEYVALTDTKEVYTFGWDGVNNMLTVTKHPTLSNIIAITRPHAGYELNPHFLALQEDGILCGWGDNSKGQLGATAPITVPITNPVCGIEDLIVDTTSPPTTTVPPSYTLTVTKAGNGIGTVTASYNSSSEIIDCGTVCTADYVAGRTVMLNASEGAGSAFAGWTGNCIDANITTDPRMKTITINAPVTCIATFTKYSYPFTINKAGTGNGTVTASPGDLNCGATCNANYFQGDTLTLSAIPDIGSEFSGWSGKCASTNTVTTLAIDGPANCTATFDKVPDRILTKIGTGSGTVTSSAGVAGLGINCGTLCQAPYAQKTPVTLKATPDRNSQFHGWAGGCAEQFTITSNLNCTATFDLITYPLQINHDGTGKGTVVSTPAGIDCGKDCAVDYITGTRVTLKAIPQLGATFSGWSGNCKGTNNPLQVIMNYPLTCVATFKADEPNIVVSPAAYEFKNVKKGTYLTKPVVIYKANLKVDKVVLTETSTANIREFSAWVGDCTAKPVPPAQQCYVSVTFRPVTVGNKQATMTVYSNASNTPEVVIPLTGSGQTPADYADTNVTIESKGDPANNRWDSEGAWLRQPNSTGPNRPTETDVVRIKSGHTILGNSSINVRTLCIDSGGTLESNPQSTVLSVYAKDAIENNGAIRGRRGAEERPNQTVCASPNTYYDYHCAQRGTSLYLSVNRADNNGQKPPFYNAGVILAGEGGAGKQHGALGGDVYIQANGFTNVPGSGNGGFIGGGKGGDIVIFLRTGTKSSP